MLKMFFLLCLTLSVTLVTSLPTSFEPKIGDFSHLMLQFDIDSPKPNFFVKQYPHEKWCHYYYNWEIDDIFTIRKCPKGEVFDYHSHQCQDKTSAKCWSHRYGKTKLHDHIHSKWRKHFRCPFSTGKYPDIFDCDKFFLCVDGKAKHKHCPESKQFDRILRHCVSEDVALCADETDADDISHRCPKSSGNFGHPKDCSKYYHCRKGKAHLKTCKKGTLFHDEHQKCMKSNEVPCGHILNYHQTATVEKENESVLKVTPILDVYDEPKEVLKDSLSKPNKINVDIVLVDANTEKKDPKTSKHAVQSSTVRVAETAKSTQTESKTSTEALIISKEDHKTSEPSVQRSTMINVQTEKNTQTDLKTPTEALSISEDPKTSEPSVQNSTVRNVQTEKNSQTDLKTSTEALKTSEPSVENSSVRQAETEKNTQTELKSSTKLLVISEEDHTTSEHSMQNSTDREVKTENNTREELKISTEALIISESTDGEFIPTLNNTQKVS